MKNKRKSNGNYLMTIDLFYVIKAGKQCLIIFFSMETCQHLLFMKKFHKKMYISLRNNLLKIKYQIYIAKHKTYKKQLMN